ncbi:RNA 2',3'-cyclic phosphodiesterase [Candidatus Marithioploca araucensis]|uniref:RNA 2',3'-cyclic phosphodiesterase n=1 Tax=Candidatus Marithioploca araucensis TaxID=70273 RepID=A0ABT7VQI3_9GAMM|nr:RNA 2',3'-cyclic phosphodiesterase [Thiotrichales bacterium HSG14]MDM8561923.1 RNA 2',3'-cyclic phosphodiesterase [Candidatus Marithioploca araucensis]
MSNNSTERLFFALWLNEDVRQALTKLSQPVTQNIQGKIIPPENWHITLAFLGEVDIPTKQCMQQVAASVQGRCFNLSLDKLSYWSRTGILWLGANQIPNTLQDLVTRLSTDLQDCGYHPETRPFKTHVTLMRRANKIKMLPPITPIRWTVEDFCLVRSTLNSSGAHYEVIERWLLT